MKTIPVRPSKEERMSLARFARGASALAALIASAVLAAAPAHARPQYARKEMKSCVYCHVQPGGDRNFRGMYYAMHNRSFADFDNTFEAKAAGVNPDSMGPDAVPKNSDY